MPLQHNLYYSGQLFTICQGDTYNMQASSWEGGVGVRFGVVPVTCPLLTVNELEAAFQNLDSMRWCMAVKRRGRCLSFNEPAAHLPLLGRTAGLPASQGGSQGQGGPCTSNAGRGTAGAAHGAWRRRRRPRRPRRRAAGKRWPSHAPLGAAGRHALLTSPSPCRRLIAPSQPS